MGRVSFSLMIIPIVVAVVLSAYFGLQFQGFLRNSYDNQSIIVQTRVTGVQFVDSNVTVAQGYFRFNLTFQNPTVETLQVMRIEGDYREAGYIIAGVYNQTSELIHPGDSHILRRFYRDAFYYVPPNLTPGENPTWTIRYHLKLGTSAYEMVAAVTGVADQNIQTTGPFSSDYDETFSAATTYVLAIVDSWVIALEILTVFMIAQVNTQGKLLTLRTSSHNVMLSVIFALQGSGVIAALPYFYWINSFVPHAPPEFSYYGGGGATALALLVLIITGIGLLFLFVAAGLLLRSGWGRVLGFISAILSGLAFSLGAVGMLLSLTPYGVLSLYRLLLAVLFLAVVAADAVALFLLAYRWRRPSGAFG